MHANRFHTEDYAKFEGIYNKYAPKLFGFITQYTHTKEHAELYMEKVFAQVARDLNYYDLNTENKLLNTVLLICKPILKPKKLKNYSIAI